METSEVLSFPPKLFCNIQDQCISDKNNDCLDLENHKKNIDEQTLQAIYVEFESTYGEKEDDLRTRIDEQLLSNINLVQHLKKIEKTHFYKYDNLRNKIGDSIIDTEIYVSSPYEFLRDIILEHGDIVKKQYNIQRFALHFTRKAYESENQYWLYCHKTNTKLLPTFLSHLANIYVSKGDYIYELDVVCTNQGTISDDGEAWVDKHSGYFIKNIDLDSEEGFTEEGFKLKTREALEADLGDAILDKGRVKSQDMLDDGEFDLEESGKNNNKNNLETEETKKISNIISAVSGFMGISLNNEKNFIIKNVLNIYELSVPSEKDYNISRNKAIEKGKKNIPSYEETKDLGYLIISLVFILIGIQVSIPSIKSRKTFPGCIKSFTGYPLNGSEKSALLYIACIANKIKSSIEPWNSIKKLNETGIAKRMEAIIEKFVIDNQSVKERIKEKHNYLKIEVQDVLLLEYDIEKLRNFYPPLIGFKITNLVNISDTFKKSLLENIRTGSYFQQDQILTVKSKIIFYSLSIQEKIQQIISKNSPLITNNASVPFLENACCDDKSTNVYNYFLEADKTITTTNNIINDLDNILYDINTLTKAPMFFDPRNTKHKYQDFGLQFSKETIYKAFIVFCNKKAIILDDKLRDVCIQGSEGTVEEQIEKLKDGGINYDEQLLQKLLTIVNLKNSIHLNLNNKLPNSVQILRDLLKNTELNETNVIPQEFVQKFNNLLDRYSIVETDDTLDARDLRNYLATTNETLLKNIENFIKINSKLSKTKFKNFQECLQNITSFSESGDNIYIDSKDETIFKMTNFIKNSITNIVDIFPNIILNQVDYSSINIPRHWKLSQKHTIDIKEIVNKYYLKLKQFYGNNDCEFTLKKIQTICKNIQLLAINTPFFAAFTSNTDKVINSIFDRRLSILLFKYYFLTILDIYITFVEDARENVLGLKSLSSNDSDDPDDPDDVDERDKMPPETLSNYIVSIMDILCDDKKVIDYNRETIMEKILRSKEKEKDNITDYLKNLTDEEREIENVFKNQKLEKWSKGLQKGLTQYVQENYDEERDDLEKQAIKEKKLGISSLVTDMNRDIYGLDYDDQTAIDDEISAEENNLENLANDDDFGDLDGDEDY